ncbi:SAM-dependent methyltransferase [Gloeomargarita lithophora Alchichica-D10]|uniref:SAM-dependent methyltransferase n=1 Tax=Gloeomargarita lithophora Alchichica-D10 TaxID=1188229 RepID=A0A1J0AAR2_9CYAN|nr:class I SAM-dependent methyltransferase [Gloeomargarita lithophora]APB33024.1 SAM-dependent methyltransferase [Gloeomargarita lithophora Alchichica-D10]
MQEWNPTQYAQTARFVSDLGEAVLALLAPQPGERILDLGCGDGVLTLKLQTAGCRVVGIDASPEMVMATQSRGLTAHVMDGMALPFDREFDAVFSNAALHWMPQPEAVISGVWRALKPGGRFVGELGGQGNIATILTALETTFAARGLNVPYPCFFPDPTTYRQLLEAGGFSVPTIELIPRPTPLPGDLRDWLMLFAQSSLAWVLPEERADFITEVVARLRPQLYQPDGVWVVDYVRLRFLAQKPPNAP